MTTADDRRSGKYLIFKLGAEDYGLHVRHVREILGVQEVTSVPHTPPQVRGVINLRGKIVPLVDLRVHCGMPVAGSDDRTSVIVLQLRKAGETVLIGVVVDSVTEVLGLSSADIDAPPDFGTDLTHILGLARVKGRVKILLDTDELLADWQTVSMEAVLQHTRKLDAAVPA